MSPPVAAAELGQFKWPLWLCCCVCSHFWTLHPAFPALKVDATWRVGFHRPVVAAQMSRQRITPVLAPPKARIIQLNTRHMTPSALTREMVHRHQRGALGWQTEEVLWTADTRFAAAFFWGTDTHVGLCYYVTQQAKERRGKTPVDRSWSRFLPVKKGVSPTDIYVCRRCCWNPTWKKAAGKYQNLSWTEIWVQNMLLVGNATGL